MNDTQTVLAESTQDVTHLITTTSWLLMDDDQRDDLMTKVIEPRYMAVTSDGIKLGPKWWAEQTGANPKAITSRVNRLRAKALSTTDSDTSAPTDNQQGSVRSAKAALKKHPELADKLVEDDDVAAAIVEAAARKLAEKKKTQRREKGPRKKTTTGLEGSVILTSLDVISSKLDDVIEVSDTQEGEVKELINNSLDVIGQKTELIRAKVNNDLDWDEANKKELA